MSYFGIDWLLYSSIHSSSIATFSCRQGHRGLQGAFPRCHTLWTSHLVITGTETRQGKTLMDSCWLNCPTCMCLDCGRKPKHPERTHVDPSRPGETFLQRGNSANHCTTISLHQAIGLQLSRSKWQQPRWASRYWKEIWQLPLAHRQQEMHHCGLEMHLTAQSKGKKLTHRSTTALPLTLKRYQPSDPTPPPSATFPPPHSPTYCLAGGSVPSPLRLSPPVFLPPIVFSLYLHLSYLMTWQLFRSLLYEAPSSVTYVHGVIRCIITNQWILLLYSGEHIQFPSPRETGHTTSYPSCWRVCGGWGGLGATSTQEARQQCFWGQS